jgi:hypothetical protein
MHLLLAVLVAGLHGTVMRGPITPVCVAEKPCTAPARGVVLIFSRSGHDVARARTGTKGEYVISLAPGRYAVRLPTAPRIGTGLRPQVVLVPRGRSAAVNFSIDTGIR